MRRRWLKQVRADLVWVPAAFAVLQLGLAFGIDRWLPQVLDPNYAAREKRLLARRRETPGRPLVVMIGSSRTQIGLQAARLGSAAHGRPALVFNFGMPGGGPLLELVSLRRLLAAGLRPDLLFVEITPPLLTAGGGCPMEEGMLIASRLQPSEFVQLTQYCQKPWRLWLSWGLAQAVPAAEYRAELRYRIALDAAKPWTSQADPFGTMDQHGWQPMCVSVTPEQRQRLTGLMAHQYGHAVRDPRLAGKPVQALRELLGLCRNEGIPVALVMMPEASTFRAFYARATQTTLDAFVTGLSHEWQVPLIDARCWVEDSGFYDTNHLLPEGAAVFTERFAREALGPLLEQTLQGLAQKREIKMKSKI